MDPAPKAVQAALDALDLALREHWKTDNSQVERDATAAVIQAVMTAAKYQGRRDTTRGFLARLLGTVSLTCILQAQELDEDLPAEIAVDDEPGHQARVLLTGLRRSWQRRHKMGLAEFFNAFLYYVSWALASATGRTEKQGEDLHERWLTTITLWMVEYPETPNTTGD